MSDYSDLPDDVKMVPEFMAGAVVVLGSIEIFKLFCQSIRGILWGGVLVLLWILMIVLPVLGVILLLGAIFGWDEIGKVGRTILAAISVILILAGPVNHTLVRSPLNVFHPYGRVKTVRVKRPVNEYLAFIDWEEKYFPYKHTAFDKAVINILDLETKGEKIAKWAKIQYESVGESETQ